MGCSFIDVGFLAMIGKKIFSRLRFHQSWFFPYYLVLNFVVLRSLNAFFPKKASNLIVAGFRGGDGGIRTHVPVLPTN